ncbi:MAG: MBL fold metallo-hydrolase [Candidatus Microthrix sp.]|nr:MBL fold metallo-hydrolase [Candidatus Microthrix sp.]MBK7321754.1 MBL fold metallo-hydrolase [Candidatus Microthrix sp.]
MRVLVDCGEAAQHRLFAARIPPNSIDAVCCTHLHGDHVLGLPGLLGTMGMDDRRRPLRLIGPTGLSDLIDGLAATPALTITIPLELEEHDPAWFPARRDAPHPDRSEVGVAIAPSTIGCQQSGSVSRRPTRREASTLRVSNSSAYRMAHCSDASNAANRSARRMDPPFGRPTSPGPSERGHRWHSPTTPVHARGARALAAGVDLLVHEATFAQADA